MPKTEEEIIQTAMQSWKNKDSTNEFWFKSMIQGAWRSGYAYAKQEAKQEAERESEICLGDEVEVWDMNKWVKFIAVGDIGDGTITGFDLSGGAYEYPKCDCRKTGKKWKVVQDG